MHSKIRLKLKSCLSVIILSLFNQVVYHNHIYWVIMPKYCAIILNYAQVRQEGYYAQIYAGTMCQGLTNGHPWWVATLHIMVTHLWPNCIEIGLIKPLICGHPSIMAEIFGPKWWPLQRGSAVYLHMHTMHHFIHMTCTIVYTWWWRCIVKYNYQHILNNHCWNSYTMHIHVVQCTCAYTQYHIIL